MHKGWKGHTTPLEIRFWNWVDKNGPTIRPELGPCWVWTGHKFTGKQYGQITVGQGKAKRAHRVSWELTFGVIPLNLCICHKCDNPPCVRPEHLFLGTSKDNTQDMIQKGRKPKIKSRNMKGSKHPRAKFTEEQVKEIRLDERSHQQVADEYKVSKATIALMRQGRNWKHVAINQ